MVVYRTIIICALFAALVPLSGPAWAGDLTFEDRVEAQRAIERVYHVHREGESRTLAEVVPDPVLRAKVRRTLGRSVALARFWNRPITGEMLRRETERMMRDSRMPERLEELFAALKHDPVLIQECLARASLVDRLLDNYFATDDRIHVDARRETRRVRDALVRGEIPPDRDHPNREVVELVRQSVLPRSEGESGRHAIELDDESFRAARARLSKHVDGIGPLREERGAFFVEVLLEDGLDNVRIARFAVDKLTLDEWWSAVAPQWSRQAVPTVASVQSSLLPESVTAPGHPFSLTEPRSAAESCDGEWRDLASALPHGRLDHSAVWTGSEMIIWGGSPGGPDAGERYDPATDTWTPIPQTDAPAAQSRHTAVWTGTEMIVWGGNSFGLAGDRYDPVAGTWATTSAQNAPAGRRDHTAVWTGTEMIVWGGQDIFGVPLETGGRYDPETDTWTPMTSVGAPLGRLEHGAVWSGTEMIVWGGGQDFSSNTACLDGPGGRYDPATDTWTAMSTVDAPTGRAFHAMAWTGAEMIVWGGSTCGRNDRNGYATGGRYDPSTDSWTATPMVDAPSGRLFHTATWAGDRLVVWGGSTGENYSQLVDTLDTGSSYDPSSDSWIATVPTGAPVNRSRHTTVWTGSEMIVWGGHGSDEDILSSGGRYAPMTNTWVPTAAANGPSSQGEVVWTGSEMIVWGSGFDRYGDDPIIIDYNQEGARYDPATDNWSPTSTLGAPEGRRDHTLVWTGSVVIAWGGENQDDILSSGGRYDPAVDSWTLTSLVDAPALSEHTAVWTGNEMIVWGGNYYEDPGVGARYNPASDSWTPTSLTNAPAGRLRHTAVWTGNEMVVWGGARIEGGVGWLWINSGGRYDPATDAWTPTSMTAVPGGRERHTAVWTGSEMIVWGGLWSDDANDIEGNYDTGGRYDPVTDSWTPTSVANAPTGRGDHTAVWTGEEMVVWSGMEGAPRLFTLPVNTGGRYDPVGDDWTPTPMVDAPTARVRHGAVWAGDKMFIRGGSFFLFGFRNGSALDLNSPDADADTFCRSGDCNDDDPSVYPGAPEINDGLDNQCPGDPGYGMVDEVSGDAGFGDASEFSWQPQLGASSYEAARSTTPGFSADCTIVVVTEPAWVDSAIPDQHGAFFYLARALTPLSGSWGRSSAGDARSVCE